MTIPTHTTLDSRPRPVGLECGQKPTEPKSPLFVALLGFAQFGIFVALLGPVMVSMALKVNSLIASGMGVKGLLLGEVPRPLEEVVADAEAAARGSEVAVVVVGLTPEQETEGSDKTTLALPGDQDALVRAVAAAAPRTVVVVNTATPVLMPWADQVDAILVVGLPGQEGGYAVADALLGEREPAGRLVTTWPAADGAAPAWVVEPTDLKLDYSDDIFVGYRGWQAGRAQAPAHWFGAGEGYGSWDYTDAALVDTASSPARRGASDGESGAQATAPVVRVSLRNTGTRPSREVVQVYLQPAETDQPVRLVGWSAVTVDPGESTTVDVVTDPRLWRRWDDAANGWVALEPGGELLVARGLGDVRSRLPLG